MDYRCVSRKIANGAKEESVSFENKNFCKAVLTLALFNEIDQHNLT